MEINEVQLVHAKTESFTSLDTMVFLLQPLADFARKVRGRPSPKQVIEES